jgi:hypothetical protein
MKCENHRLNLVGSGSGEKAPKCDRNATHETEPTWFRLCPRHAAGYVRICGKDSVSRLPSDARGETP